MCTIVLAVFGVYIHYVSILYIHTVHSSARVFTYYVHINVMCTVCMYMYNPCVLRMYICVYSIVCTYDLYVYVRMYMCMYVCTCLMHVSV